MRFPMKFTLFVPVLLAACATSPAPRQLALALPAYTGPQVGVGGTAMPLRVAPVGLPESLDRAPLVWQLDDHERAPDASARWAQPLKQEVAQALAAHLAQATANPRVLAGNATLGSEPYRTLQVDIIRLELRDGGDAVLEALWLLRAPDGRPAASARITLSRSAQEKGPEGAARTLSALVGELAGKIAPALR